MVGPRRSSWPRASTTRPGAASSPRPARERTPASPRGPRRLAGQDGYNVAGNSTTSGSRTFMLRLHRPPGRRRSPAGPPASPTATPRPSPGPAPDRVRVAVSQAGAATPVQSRPGRHDVTLAPLPGRRLHLPGHAGTAAGVSSDEATRSFQVEHRPAPPAPTITARPSFPTALTDPSFAWTSEEARVVPLAGPQLERQRVQGPNDTPLPSATIGAVVPARTASGSGRSTLPATSSAAHKRPFSVVGAARHPAAVHDALDPAAPQRRQAVPARRDDRQDTPPLLRWKSGAEGDDALQPPALPGVRRTPGKASMVRRSSRAFPQSKTASSSRPQGDLPAAATSGASGRTSGNKFTPKPLGISNFCVAKASVLRSEGARVRRPGPGAARASTRLPAPCRRPSRSRAEPPALRRWPRISSPTAPAPPSRRTGCGCCPTEPAAATRRCASCSRPSTPRRRTRCWSPTARSRASSSCSRRSSSPATSSPSRARPTTGPCCSSGCTAWRCCRSRSRTTAWTWRRSPPRAPPAASRACSTRSRTSRTPPAHALRGERRRG